MIARYTRPAMAAIWSEQRKYENWLRVELAATDALCPRRHRARRQPPKPSASAPAFTVERIHAIEAETRHDVLAFTTAVAESVGPDARWLHYGLTSTDVVDTAQALALTASLRDHPCRHPPPSRGPAPARHRVPAHAHHRPHPRRPRRTHHLRHEAAALVLRDGTQPAPLRRRRRRPARRQDLRRGRRFGNLKPEHEAAILAELGLAAAPISTQVLQRDRHAAYITTLAVLASTLDKIALEIRHLQRTEVREAEEFFSAGQKGSSAMPHKRNPITCENICGLARVVRGNAQVALENVALWHERDISHSSAERVILPDTTILADYMLDKTATPDREAARLPRAHVEEPRAHRRPRSSPDSSCSISPPPA